MSIKFIALQSADGHKFHLPESIAFQCGIIRKMAPTNQNEVTIPFPTVNAVVLEKAIEYLILRSRYATSPNKYIFENFEIPDDVAVDLLLVANYLEL